MSINNDSEQVDYAEYVWRTYLTTGEYKSELRQRSLFRLLPGYPRCRVCYAPFKGLGSGFVRAIFDKHPSALNPHLCNV